MINYDHFVKAVVAATRVPELLRSRAAVVLERLARGGGATNWYYCPDQSRLTTLISLLRPGSVVSFYFDGRICHERLSSEVDKNLRDIIAKTGDAVVGMLCGNGLQLDMTVVTGPNDLSEVFASRVETTTVFYGAFPARDNDGERAVTVTLPDSDGVVRLHPH